MNWLLNYLFTVLFVIKIFKKIQKIFGQLVKNFLTSTTSDKNFGKIFPEIFAGNFQKFSKIFENFTPFFFWPGNFRKFRKIVRNGSFPEIAWISTKMSFCPRNILWNWWHFHVHKCIKFSVLCWNDFFKICNSAQKNFAFFEVVLFELAKLGKIACFFKKALPPKNTKMRK